METTDAPQLIEHINHHIEYTCNETRWVPSTARLCAIGEQPNGNGVIDIFELNVNKFFRIFWI